jgi:hypothetical protein
MPGRKREIPERDAAAALVRKRRREIKLKW